MYGQYDYGEVAYGEIVPAGAADFTANTQTGQVRFNGYAATVFSGDFFAAPTTGRVSFTGQIAQFTAGSSASGRPDLGHSIHQNLIFFLGSHPSDSPSLGYELISNEIFRLFGSTNLSTVHPTRADWRCLQIQTTSSGAWVPLSNQFKTLTADFTVWADVVFIAMDSYAHLICVPWSSAASWTSPYTAFASAENGASTSGYFQITPVNTLTSYSGPVGSWPVAIERKRLWLRRSGTNLAFGVAGAQVGSNVTVTGASPNWNLDGTNPGNKVVLSNRKPEAAGEGLAATYLRFMVYNRALTNQELTDLNNDPLLGLYTDIVPDVTANTQTGQIRFNGYVPTIVSNQTVPFTASPATGMITFVGQVITLVGPKAPLTDTDTIVFAVEIDLIIPGS